MRPPFPSSSEPDQSDSTTGGDALVPEEYVCPLTLTVMNDPVVSKFGHSYEREAILKWLIEHQSCPMTRQPLKLSDLITNHQLRARIRKWQVDYEQDITVVCATLDFENRVAGGYYFLPDLDDTERSDEDDENAAEEAAPGTTRVIRLRGAPVSARPARRPGQWPAAYYQRRRRQQQQAPPSADAPQSNPENRNGSSSLNALSRRIFGGRPATAA